MIKEAKKKKREKEMKKNISKENYVLARLAKIHTMNIFASYFIYELYKTFFLYSLSSPLFELKAEIKFLAYKYISSSFMMKIYFSVYEHRLYLCRGVMVFLVVENVYSNYTCINIIKCQKENNHQQRKMA